MQTVPSTITGTAAVLAATAAITVGVSTAAYANPPIPPIGHIIPLTLSADAARAAQIAHNAGVAHQRATHRTTVVRRHTTATHHYQTRYSTTATARRPYGRVVVTVANGRRSLVGLERARGYSRHAALVRAAWVRAHLYPNAAWGITSVFPAGTQVYVVR